MSYLGRSAKLSLKAQEKVSFLATAGQTSKTGLSYVPSFVEVYVNGILLTDTTDFTATNGNSVTFTVALALNDEVTVVSLKTFSVAESLSKAGGTMTGDTLHGDNVKAKFGTGNDLEIYHDGNKSHISDVGTGNLILTASNLTVKDAGGTNRYLTTDASTTATRIYHNNVGRLATTATGVDVTGGLNTTGNVGIGVTPENWYSTYSVLQIGGLGAIFAETSAGAGGATRLSNNVYLNASGSWAYQVTDEASHYQQVDGIHTFRVAASGSANSAISWNNAVSIQNNGQLFINTASTHDGNASVLITANDGGECISCKVTTDGNNALNFRRSSGDQVGRIAVGSSSTSYITSSDYRLKTDVQPMTGAVDRVKLLKPCNFEWIVDGTRVDGFLAHEAEEVVPEAVSGTKDAMRDEEYEVTAATDTEAAVTGTRSVPDMQGIDQSKLVPLLTATIQELITRIEALENV